MPVGTLLEERVAVSAVSLLVALVYVVAAVRTSGCAGQSAAARYTVVAVALAIVALCLAGIVPPAIAYGLLCLMLVSVYGSDLLKQERVRRRRVASLAPRPVADAVPVVWIATAAASAFMLTPYVVLNEQRLAALLIELCVLLTAAIAWRVATAPEQLVGDDVPAERLRDRTMRGVRCGMAAVLALGSIMVFISFENAELPSVLPFQHGLHTASKAIWSTFAVSVFLWWTWGTWRVRRLAQRSSSTSS